MTISDTKFKHRVAVYGTLKRGFGNHERLIKDAKYVGCTRVYGFVMLSQGGFPAATEFDKRCSIAVELYDLTDDMLKSCDILEGVKHGHYHRISVQLTGFGEVYLYVYKFPDNQIPAGETWCPDGVWYKQGTWQTEWLGNEQEMDLLHQREMRKGNPRPKVDQDHAPTMRDVLEASAKEIAEEEKHPSYTPPSTNLPVPVVPVEVNKPEFINAEWVGFKIRPAA